MADRFRAERILPTFQIGVAQQKSDSAVQGIQALLAAAAQLVHHVGHSQLFFQLVGRKQPDGGRIALPGVGEPAAVLLAGDAGIEPGFEHREEIGADIPADNTQLAHGVEIARLQRVALGLFGAFKQGVVHSVQHSLQQP